MNSAYRISQSELLDVLLNVAPSVLSLLAGQSCALLGLQAGNMTIKDWRKTGRCFVSSDFTPVFYGNTKIYNVA